MSNFNKLVDKLLNEMSNSAATAMGGPGGQPAGTYGNQFPSDNDKGYAYQDPRWVFGKETVKIAKPSKKSSRKNKKSKSKKINIQRRTFPISL